ncbi:DotA/TraY family protein [Acidithiobacillus sp.]|uniref:DotA/TraY family protein n=1 Tax=Acidithiobacillus sp. TaxID=1872118 RepID=UPI003D0525F0
MRKRLIFALAGLLPLLWSVPGLASTFSTTPASDDMILSILAHTIGPAIHQISSVGSGTVSDITTALMDINSLVLILGGLLLTYVIGASVMKTAHEGEPLGQKWSSMWIPMKAAAGAALILPVPSLGGLSAAQGIVIWLLSFSIGAGDGLWAQSISYIAKDPVGSVVVSPVNTGQIAEGIISSQVCELGVNKTANNWWPGAAPISRTGPTLENTINPLDAAAHVFEGYQETVSPLPGDATYATQYSEYMWTADGGGLLGKLTSLGLTSSVCGKVAYVSGAEGTGMGASMVNTIGSDNGTALGTLITSLKPISTNLYDEKKPGTDDTNFVKAINAYDTTMQTDIQNAANTAMAVQVSKYVSAAKIDGFATAGEWFWDIVQWNEVAQQAANSLGDATGINMGSALGKLGSSHIDNAEARAASFVKQNGSLVGHVQPTKNASSDIGGVFAQATPLLIDAITSTNSNPLIAIRNLGTGMELAGGAVYVGSALLTATVAALNGNTVEKAVAGEASNPAAKVVYYDVTPILLFLAGVLFVEGFFLSFVVPLIPFMVWVAGLLGFLLMAFEMIVAAPLWGIMHMHPEGHEVVGMGATGYKIALAIMVRPFLMVLGLLGGYALFMGFTALVTPMITKAVVSSQDTGGGITGPLDMVGAVGVYAMLMVIIAYEAFKLVFVLPERVMAWASAGHQGYNEGGVVDKQKGAHDGAKDKGSHIAREHNSEVVNSKRR